MTFDARDFTKAPPAYLPIPWVIRMRDRLREFQATGSLEWYKKGPDWSPSKTTGREDAPEGATNNVGGN